MRALPPYFTWHPFLFCLFNLYKLSSSNLMQHVHKPWHKCQASVIVQPIIQHLPGNGNPSEILPY